jgi:hypothetical protein
MGGLNFRRWPDGYIFSIFYQINRKLLNLYKKNCRFFENPQVLLKKPVSSPVLNTLHIGVIIRYYVILAYYLLAYLFINSV